MNASLWTWRIGVAVGILAGGAFWAGSTSAAEEKSLAEQIFDTMIQLPGNNPAYRAVHAKG